MGLVLKKSKQKPLISEFESLEDNTLVYMGNENVICLKVSEFNLIDDDGDKVIAIGVLKHDYYTLVEKYKGVVPKGTELIVE